MGGQILLVSGPSGSGKSTLLSRLLAEFAEETYFSISSTTRAIREGEKEGVNYYYVSEKEFKKGIDEGQFLEWACVHNNYYGTPIAPALAALEEGKIAIFDIDVQGFHLARKKFANFITSVFLTAPSREELRARLQKRGTDSAEVIENRLFNAAVEMEHLKEYDYVIVNDDLERAYESLRGIFVSMKSRAAFSNLNALAANWNIKI